MRRLLLSLLVTIGLLACCATPVLAQVTNLCGPSTGGPVCLGTVNGQPIELWQGSTKIRFLGVTFLPVADDEISFGDSTHRFKNATFSGTVTATSLVGATSFTNVTFSATGAAIRGTTTTGETWLIQGYDNNTGPGYVTFATITNGNSPSLTFAVPAGGGTINFGTPTTLTLTNATGLPVSTGVSGLGANVATALGVAVGSAGAVVVNGGALGTPSSGTLSSATGLPVSTGISGLGTGVATALAANVGSAGAPVVNGGALGTPSSGTLSNATGLPIATGVANLAANVATALTTPTSSNVAAAVTDETGTGALVFGTGPTVTHTLAGGTAPTIASGFGTGPTIAGKDEAMRVTVGTGGDTAGVISFGAGTWANAPACTANNETTGNLTRAVASTTQVTINAVMVAADKITIICRGF